MEMLIATMLFTIIMIIGTGAVLNVNAVHKKTQKMRAVIDSLHFVMEDMARSLRVGSDYICSNTADFNTLNPSFPNCGNGVLISFEAVDGDPQESGDQVAYKIDFNPIDPQNLSVFKSENSGGVFFQLTPSEVEIDEKTSGFTVFGASTGDGQPRAIIRLNGVVITKDFRSPFSIQTTVSQRLLEAPED